jgi:hypothetical protein
MNKLIIIRTHNGVFHSDELAAIALLIAYKEITEYKVIRTRDDIDADYTIDVGMEYNHTSHFDHHQFKPYEEYWGVASVGLIAQYLRPILCSSNLFKIEHNHLIKDINQRDTRVNYSPSGEYEELFNNISDCNSIDIYSEEQGTIFNYLLSLFIKYFSNDIDLDKLKLQVEKLAVVNKSFKTSTMEKRFSELEQVDTIMDIPVYRHPEDLYVDTKMFDANSGYILIYYDVGQANYTVTCNTDYCVIEDIENKVFIHANGFLAKTTDKEPFFRIRRT